MKNNTITSIIITLCVFSFFACKRETCNRITTDHIEINSPYNPENHSFSISFIQLETNGECEIGNITNLKAISKGYIVLDTQLSKRIVMFNHDGKYISNIGKHGNGPGEYIRPISFSISPDETEIAIIDGDKKSVIFYSLIDFSFKNETKMPFNASYMEYLNGNSFIWYNKEKNIPHLLIKTDANLKVEKTFLERDFFSGYVIGLNRKLYKTGNNIYTYTPFSPILHEIKNDSITKTIGVSFGEFQFPSISFFEQECGEDQKNYIPALLESDFISYFEIFENNDFFCIPFFVKDVMYYGFHDKRKNSSFKITQADIQELLKVGYYSSPIGIDVGGEFISLLNPDLIREIYEEHPNELNNELKEIIKKSKEGDNPILLRLTIHDSKG